MSDERFIKPLSKALSDSERLALVLIAEEAAELVQAATKCLRFGLTKFNPHNPEAGTNLEQLTREMADVVESHERFVKAHYARRGRASLPRGSVTND